MSALFGTTWKINRFASPTYYELGGTVLDARIDPRVTVADEVGSGEGRALASQKAVEAKPVIEWTMNIRRLDDYITTYAMITAEGEVPEHILYATDGTEHHALAGCKVDRCTIRINTRDSIRAELSVPFKSRTAPSIGTFLYRTDKAMYKDAVTAFNIGSAVLKWSDIEIGVDNNVLQEVLGTDVTPSEVKEQEARYTVTATRAKPAAGLLPTALLGTPQNVSITLTDNQAGGGVAKTFNFADMYISTSRIEDRALGIIMEKITCKGKSLVIPT